MNSMLDASARVALAFVPERWAMGRYRFECRVRREIRFSDYAGSTLRGAFGHALKSLGCVTRASSCEGCLLVKQCAYTSVFEPHHRGIASKRLRMNEIPVPYVIEPPPWGQRHFEAGSLLSFEMVLVGKEALAQLPIVILAWRRALMRGVGQGDGTAELELVYQVTAADETCVYDIDEGELHPHESAVVIVEDESAASHDLELTFVSPLRVQQKGRPLWAQHITPRALFSVLVRRVGLMSELYLGKPVEADFAAIIKLSESWPDHRDLGWRDWSRHSSRQQQDMTLGGLFGRWAIEGVPSGLVPLFELGQWLHAGSNASFGMGRYVLEKKQ